MSNNRTEKVQIITPDNGWDNGIAIIKICLSACNPMPKLEGEQFRSFQPLRPLKAMAVVVGSCCIAWGCLGAARGTLFPAPLSENADSFQRVGHTIGASYFRPVATGLIVGSKASLATVEADFRASEGTAKATPVPHRKLTTSEVEMLQQFTGKALLVDFEGK